MFKADADIKKSLEIIYDVELDAKFEKITLEHMYPTQDFLENDKLALVFMKVVAEGYDVPIVGVERDEDYFILDGHHRSFIAKKLEGRAINAYVLRFPAKRDYRTHPREPLEGLAIRHVAPMSDPILATWEQILTVTKYYEALHDCYFTLRKEMVPLSNLVPTQSAVKRTHIDSIIEILVPIVCIKHGNRYYVLDGHARSLRANQLGMKEIKAMILSPQQEVKYGIVKTAQDINLQSLNDIRIED